MTQSTNSKGITYDFVCYRELAYEFNVSYIPEVEKKIKRRLKYYLLGSYNQERVNYLRALRNDLYNQMTKDQKFRNPTKSKGKYAGLEDFNVEGLKK